MKMKSDTALKLVPSLFFAAFAAYTVIQGAQQGKWGSIYMGLFVLLYFGMDLIFQIQDLIQKFKDKKQS